MTNLANVFDMFRNMIAVDGMVMNKVGTWICVYENLYKHNQWNLFIADILLPTIVILLTFPITRTQTSCTFHQQCMLFGTER